MNYKKILMSKITLIGLVIVLGFASYSLTNLILKNRRMKTEVKSLEKKIDTLTVESFKTKELLEYLRGKSFNEKEARLKLNLLEPGEEVAVILGGEQQSRETALSVKKSNLKKWFDYFFGT